MNTFAAQDLATFAQTVLAKAGARDDIAAATATYLLEGDLLGFSTHGLKRLYFNAKLLADGKARGDGAIKIVRDRAAVATWDAAFLPGPYVAAQAVEAACAKAKIAGTGSIVVKRAQHVASLAAYLRIATEQGLLVNLICSTPAQSSVAPFGAKQALFSPNPYAVGVPTSTTPILIDISLSMTAAGKVRQFWERGEALPWPALITATGELSQDPSVYIEGEGAAILPLGGHDLGYKGSALCLMSEIWTMGLSNYGRSQGPDDGESNSLFVQVLDPAAFGEPSEFIQQADDLVARMQACTPIDSTKPVRVPGQRALQYRQQQLAEGVQLDSATVGRLERAAERFDVAMPKAMPKPMPLRL
ncbi:Ldh family oxidoreductase [Aliidiomarina maris]|uniref:LDH2 family malate/lactate/ureidoglycolate dehydrogenase n=1 Tax=Aliidiomarina maris TaxID=531312 RepID=A0A327WQJ3_9GAMM|nr:Ldh family oxidoreductase [Aliidiomarina maris]RAJ94628.1 LDH2 family malate/lactate/ureidoglycolate dehydrogenase [Aliidiomarina maris]RUO19729.1 lactate dehydrogenase [Aliidiomarina maris]